MLKHDESTTKTPQQVNVGVKLRDDGSYMESVFPLASVLTTFIKICTPDLKISKLVIT